ncbi:hypothetical protein EDB92DRAFT_570425 [Lactarius akahatsu]|uniref:Uncharacterized protein n=1 Tax=Lactarius akahatsu TaxID=416441 RepID=A0AAD4QE98_9AGAM|nr:hypothetical protein EDB92DRAFT_570425 [Lactarius akahatsu]
MLELRRLPCGKTRADAGAILAKQNSVREHDRDDLGLPNISRHGQGLWTYSTRASNTVLILRAATLLPHRVLTVSEASGLVIYVQVCNPVEIEAKARELFEGSDVIDPPGIRRCACSSHLVPPFPSSSSPTASPLTLNAHAAGHRNRRKTPIPWLVIAFVASYSPLYSEEDQLSKERPAERTVRPTVHARRTPLVGFTTV